MKKIILLFALLISTVSFAQRGFNYKALLVDNGSPVANSIITVKATIKQGTTAKWVETHSNVHTDANGIFAIAIGEGTRVSGVPTFDEIKWGYPNMNLTIEVDTGSGYTTLVNGEALKAVPYAKNGAKLLGTATYLGYQAGFSETHTNEYTVGIGYQALQNANGVDYTTAVGYQALMNATTGGYNTAIGRGAGLGVTTGQKNIFIGYQAGYGAPATTSNKLYIDTSNTNNPLIYGDFSTNDIKINGDFEVTGDFKGKVKADASGDADMKAYIYGRIASNGTIISNASSSGFTATRSAIGTYNITFTNSPGDDEKYIVVATAQGSYNNIGITQFNSSFILYVRNLSTNNYDDSITSFVVYKK